MSAKVARLPDVYAELEQERRRAVRDEDGNPIEGDLLEFVHDKTGLPVGRVLRCGEDSFDVELNVNGRTIRVPLGDAAGIYSPRVFEKRIAGRTGLPVSTYYADKRWRPIAAALLAAAEVEEGAGSTEAEETLGWIASYVRTFAPFDFKRGDAEDEFRVLDIAESYEDAHPLIDGQRRLYLPALPLMQHVNRHVGARTSVAALSQRLGRLGFRPVRLQARRFEEIRKRRFRVSPPGFDAEGAEGG